MPLPLIPIIGLVGTVLDKLIPDKDAAEKAKSELTALLATQELQIALAQIEANTVEAKHTSIFVAGWRPFVGWACGFAFVYAYIALPLALFSVYTFGDAEQVRQISALPELDLAMMLPVLLGMLGLGGMRSFEKRTGTEGNR